MLLRIFLGFFSICLALCVTETQSRAQQNDWEAVFVEWSKSHPAQAQEWERAKKAAEKDEKKFKDFSDKTFQGSFDAVFGKDSLKPSNALEVMKMVEAASAGDLHVVGETSSGLLIAKYLPGLGQYITVLKSVASGIKSAEQAWIKGLEQTKAYEQFLQLLYSQSTGRDPYIPSYMITYLQNNKQLGAEIAKIYDIMRAREAAMFKQWTADNFEVERLILAPWASQWRSARGKVPTEQEMFNYFLYKNTRNNKPKYMEKFVDEYLRPLIARAAYFENQRFAQAMTSALNQISALAEGNSNEAKCSALNEEYKTLASSAKNLHAQITGFHAQTDNALARRYNAESSKKNEALNRRNEALKSDRRELEAEDKEVKRLISATKAINRRLDSLYEELVRMHAELPPKSDTEAYNTAASIGAAAQNRRNRLIETDYKPAKAAEEAAIARFNENLKQFQAKEKELENQAPSSFGATTKPFLDAINAFKKDNVSCQPFSRIAASHNLQGLAGISPASYTSACKTFTQAYGKLKLISASYNKDCKKG